ncbi:MAG: tripartite tricarboxylate transporter TctB family protein [Deltaproteobacteria bacterium]|nr:tripartite tricarboxylate transporter TctB family protein [Deltaproteobacteria bacterium]
MKKGEVVLSGICLAFFSFMFYEALELRSLGRFGEVGSGFWPLLSLGMTVILSLNWLVTNLRKYARERGKPTEEPPTPAERMEAWQRRRKIALCSVCLLVYIVILPWIGFILSTMLFILAFVLVLEERRKAVLIASPLLITAAVIVIFAKFITIPLPKGVGMFAEFSRLFY